MANVVGLFDTIDDARGAIHELEAIGFAKRQISFIAKDADGTYERELASRELGAGAERSEAAAGVGFGATGGSLIGGLGGLLVGLGAMTIPVIGPVIGAGTLATTLGLTALGAGIGATTGGLVGALVGAGIPEQDARLYSEGVLRGGALVMVYAETDAQTTRATKTLRRHNVVDVETPGRHNQRATVLDIDPHAEVTVDADPRAPRVE